MSYQCCSINCVNEPVAYCLCQGIPSLFCFKESIEHSRKHREHTILDIKTSPLSEYHVGLLELEKVKISLVDTKKSVLSELSQLAELIDKSTLSSQYHINNLIEYCDEVFRRALQDGNAQVINNDLIISKLASDQIQNELKDWKDKMIKNRSDLQDLIKQTLEISDLCKNQLMLLEGPKQVNNVDSLKTQIQAINNLAEDQDSFNNEIIFFQNGSKELNSINIDLFESQIKELNSLPENISSNISICELPNKSKFCYGNDSGLTFIIDKHQNIILLPDGKTNHLLDSKYHNNFVYAIGGEKKLAEKYNLLQNKWESCAPIPYNYPFGDSRSSLIGDQLVIFGFLFGKVICYDINQNNYQELNGINLEKSACKFAFTGGNRVYIGECRKNVYESGENDLTKWTCISKINPVANYYYQISYYSLINESVYFLNGTSDLYNLYKFKLRTKKIKEIKFFKNN